jgi:hypothetical protein
VESTSAYWIAPYEPLESCGFEVLQVNARHVKNVSGRKSDVFELSVVRVLPRTIAKRVIATEPLGCIVSERNEKLK